jgi:RNA-directed DNA polymerase
VREAIDGRFVSIGLELHPDKTKTVYCKDSRRHQDFDQVTFTFCGYAFRPRMAFDKSRKQVYTGFLPAVSPEKLTEMSRKLASWRIHRRTTQTLSEIAQWLNPVLRGWFNYFTVFYPSMVKPLCERIDRHLMRWAQWKYKRLKGSAKRAREWLKSVRERAPRLFAHWALRY